MAALPLCAQPGTGGIVSGTVVDIFERPVLNAILTIRNNQENTQLRTVSGNAGEFAVPALPAGSYSVEAAAMGFSPSRADITLEVGRRVELRLMLYVGGSHHTVEVKATVNTVDTAAPASVSNLDQELVEGLPSNQRRWSDYALLTPAVNPDASGVAQLSVRGLNPLVNSSTMDGADNNQAFFGEERGRTRLGYSVSQSSVQEFQIHASNYGVDMGRAAGAVINTVTRSGGNRLHGTAFAFNRGRTFSASNKYTQLWQKQADGDYAYVPYTPLDARWNWGVGVGGKIKTDKLFWFFAWDGLWRDFPSVSRARNAEKLFTTPTAQQLQVLGARMNTTTDAARTAYNAMLDELAGELGVVSRTGRQSLFFPRLDWQATERTRLIVEFNHVNWNSPAGVLTSTSEAYGRSSYGNDAAKENWLIGRWNLFLSPNVVNDMLFQWGRDFESQLSQAPTEFDQSFNHNVWGTPPQITLSPSYGFTLGKPAILDRKAYPDERRFQISDTLTWVAGRHVRKLGYDYTQVSETINNLRNQNGTYAYANTYNFISDVLAANKCDPAGTGLGNSPCYTSYTQSLGPSLWQFTTADYALFYSDQWNVAKNITFSFGVRYDYQQLPNPPANLHNPDVPGTYFTPHDDNNYGPRISVAWSPFQGGDSVLRFGYGIYYSRLVNATVLNALNMTGAEGGQRDFYFKRTDVGAPPFPYVFGSEPVSYVRPNAVYFATDFQNPQVHQAELALEQRLGRHTTVTVSALASLAHNLPNFADTNIDISKASTITYQVVDAEKAGPIQTGTYTVPFYTARLNSDYQAITRIASNTNSRYEAGVVKVSHRSGRALSLHAAYTFAHAADFNQNQSTYADQNDVLDPADFSLEYGASNYDIRHSVAAYGVLATSTRKHGVLGLLVNGYAAAPSFTFRSGRPYTMHTTGSVPEVVSYGVTTTGLGSSINGSGGDNRLPTVGRNTYRYPATMNADLRVSKTTPLRRGVNLELMVEGFNLPNRSNVTSINTSGYDIDAGTATLAPRLTYLSTFGQVTNANSTALSRERQIQFGARLRF